MFLSAGKKGAKLGNWKTDINCSYKNISLGLQISQILCLDGDIQSFIYWPKGKYKAGYVTML